MLFFLSGLLKVHTAGPWPVSVGSTPTQASLNTLVVTCDKHHFAPEWLGLPWEITSRHKECMSERTFCLACAWLAASPFRTCVSYESSSTSTLSSQAHSPSWVDCSRRASCSACSRVFATSVLSLVMSWYLALMASSLSWMIKTSSPRISKACYISWKRKQEFFRSDATLRRFWEVGERRHFS